MVKNSKRKKRRAIIDDFGLYIGIVSSIISIITLFCNLDGAVRAVLCVLALECIALILWYVIRCVLVTDKAKKKLNEQYYFANFGLARKLHAFCHDLRDYSSVLNHRNQTTRNDIKLYSNHICNDVADLYREMFCSVLKGEEISVCIKVINPQSFLEEDFTKWDMETIGRSSSTLKERNNIDSQPVKISENTDFQVIISSEYRDSSLSFSDMRTIIQDFPVTYELAYKNSRGKDFLNYYRSTIVVPIRISGDRVSSEIQKIIHNLNDRNLILGFLCIDSMKVFDSREEKKLFAMGTEYAKCLGDSLYLFFEKVLCLGLRDAKMNEGDGGN